MPNRASHPASIVSEQARPSVATVPEIENITPEMFFGDVVPAFRPVVLRGLVNDWPSVRCSRESQADFVRYLSKWDSGEPTYTIVGDPEINGRLYYGDGLRGVNFQRLASPLSATLEQILRFADAPRPPAIAVQAARVNQTLPGFSAENHMPLLDPGIEPTLWMGNRAMVAPHFDVNDNLACVIAGRRHFTVYPPDQIGNLYVGPILDAPGGVPVSTVDVRNPDLETFPRYQEALAVAMEATLDPGDAIYIPGPWWHAVESYEPLNVLVNYWYGGINHSGVSPKASLLHSIMSLRSLPDEQRRAWGTFFDHFLFAEQDPTEHWPDGIADVVTTMTNEQKRIVIEQLRASLGD